MNTRIQLLQPHDLSLTLLAALSTLNQHELDMWIDTYILGRATIQGGSTSSANQKLRAFFTSPDAIREAA